MLTIPLYAILLLAQPRQWIVSASGYCSCRKCCSPYDGTRTASGTRPRHGIIAAPKNIPFGTRLYVPGYGWGTVEDRGGAIKGNKIDLFFEDDRGKPGSGHKKALKWGRKNVRVTLVPSTKTIRAAVSDIERRIKA